MGILQSPDVTIDYNVGFGVFVIAKNEIDTHDFSAYIPYTSDSELKEGKNLSVITSDDGQEWIAIKSGTYNVSEKRTEVRVWCGCIDTPVLDHVSESYVWLIENTAPLISYVFNDDSEIIAHNRISHSKQSHEDGVKRNVAMISRAIKPLCASDVEVNAGLMM